MADPAIRYAPYRPACDAEGRDFMDRWCARCIRDAAFQAGDGDSCPIAAATMVYDEDDPEYPPEWIVTRQGPVCTAFEPIADEGQIFDERQQEIAL